MLQPTLRSSTREEKSGVMFSKHEQGLHQQGFSSALGMNGKVVPPRAYGQELILDLHGCDAARFTRREIEQFCVDLCELIDMERCDLHFWDDVGVPEEERQINPKTKGTSAVQFILTSTIVIHTLDLLKTVYVNIFSCKEFDTEEAAKFTAMWFASQEWTATVVTRR